MAPFFEPVGDGQAPVPDLPPQDAQNRSHMVFRPLPRRVRPAGAPANSGCATLHAIAVQTHPCVFTWPKYLRQASVSAALASRIWSSKPARSAAPLFMAARCSSKSFASRRTHCVHSRISLSRSGHCFSRFCLSGVPTIQTPTILRLPVLYARSPARLQTPLMGMQRGPRALRIVDPRHPCATWQVCSLECRSSRKPGSGLGG